MSIVLVIPDTHSPAEHVDAWDFLKKLKKQHKPDLIVHLGDEADFHTLSRWPKELVLPGASDELDSTVAHLQGLYDMFPNVKVCTSNHTARPFRLAQEAGIPAAFIRGYHEFLKAPKGWKWEHAWEIDGVKYEHGEGYTGPTAAAKISAANMQPTVHGHVHTWAGIQYQANSRHLFWGFNVGCLIDIHHPAFNYGRLVKSKPILGAGLVVDGIPTYVPMNLNNKGRWTK